MQAAIGIDNCPAGEIRHVFVRCTCRIPAGSHGTMRIHPLFSYIQNETVPHFHNNAAPNSAQLYLDSGVTGMKYLIHFNRCPGMARERLGT